MVKNPIEGYKWQLLAAAKGEPVARQNISNDERRLSPAQRAEGQRLAQEWEARHDNRVVANETHQITERGEAAISGVPTNAHESSFQKVTLPDRASVDLPKSWVAVTDFNHNLDEAMEAELSGIDPRKINFNPAQNKTQLIAVGKFGNSKTSVAVIYIDEKTLDQSQIASASDTDKIQFTNLLEKQIATALGSHAKINFEKVGRYESVVARFPQNSENKTLQCYQIPLGTRIVQLQFICATNLHHVWEPIWAKIVRSYAQKTEHPSEAETAGEQPKITGTGFLITRNGYLVTNHHVVKDAQKVRVQTAAGLLDAVLVRVDAASDLALLKVTGTFIVFKVIPV